MLLSLSQLNISQQTALNLYLTILYCVSQYSVSWHYTMIPAYILFITALGITLNLFVLMVLCLQKKACTMAEIYLSNLAVADLCLISVFPIFTMISTKKFNLYLSKALCKLISFFLSMNANSSINMLALVSIDRYMALVHPLTTERMRRPFYARLACVVVWGVCVLLNVPMLMYTDVIHDTRRNFSTCDLNFPSQTMLLVYEGIHVFIFMLPIFFVSCCTLKIIHEHKATVLVLVVFCVFLICWVPLYVVSILELLSRANILNGCHVFRNLYFCQFIFSLLAIFNSILNPILYLIVGKNFQTKVKELFRQMSTNLSRSFKNVTQPTTHRGEGHFSSSTGLSS
uniref:Bradykinin receptor B2 n=1 Tax=Stegastes partitus TaxID=144197 RepID=A0A3B5B3I0_9TELE